MDDSDHPLGQTKDVLDAEGRTIDEAIAAQLEADGPILSDWLVAKHRHIEGLDGQAAHAPTPKDLPPTKIRPDPSTAAGQYRGKVAPQERGEPKPGAREFPRTKFRPNDCSKTGANRG